MQDGETPLHVAAAYGKLEVVRWLLKETATATATSKVVLERGTPLHVASTHGHLAVVAALVDGCRTLKGSTGGQVGSLTMVSTQ